MKKLFAAYVVVAMTVALALPVSASASVSATEIGNVGNGVQTNNTATVNQNNATTVTQNNSATISNSIGIKSNTGGNDASRNTGGEVNISTGNSDIATQIENTANQNAARLNGCCALNSDTTVLNKGNGDSSKNNATVNKSNATSLYQNNAADITNSVSIDSNTGKNKANRNTGDTWEGSGVSISTGNSNVDPVIVRNSANSNQAAVGAGVGAAGGSSVSLGNLGNGVDSKNNVAANLNNSSTVAQNNLADISNWVEVKSNTGKNDTNRNTGGEVGIDTGSSDIAVVLDTLANSNIAALADCGCVSFGDVSVLNKGNGDSAKSDSTLNSNNASVAAQNNASLIDNAGDFWANTGKNNADRNTTSDDPSIFTGDSGALVAAETSANQNLLNSGTVAFPTAPSTSGTGMSGNWYWGWMMAHMNAY